MKSRNNKRVHSKYDKHKYELFHLARTVVLTVIAVLVLSLLVVGFSRVDGQSMHPTLKDRQPVAFLRLGNSYSFGDIVAIKMTSGESYVKRIIGMPGDVIDIRDGKVFLNGSELDEPYLNEQNATEPERKEIEYPYTVQEGAYFVMGDNRAHSTDSRSFGVVIEENIKGKLIGH